MDLAGGIQGDWLQTQTGPQDRALFSSTPALCLFGEGLGKLFANVCAVVWWCFHWKFNGGCSFVVGDARARLKSLQEGQGFEVIPTELKKACPEVAGIHQGYLVLIVFLK